MRKRATGFLLVLCGLALTYWVYLDMARADNQPVPVDPATHCRAYAELVVKDRFRAQEEAAYFATRVQELTEANRKLEAKVADMEKAKESK